MQEGRGRSSEPSSSLAAAAATSGGGTTFGKRVYHARVAAVLVRRTTSARVEGCANARLHEQVATAKEAELTIHFSIVGGGWDGGW